MWNAERGGWRMQSVTRRQWETGGQSGGGAGSGAGTGAAGVGAVKQQPSYFFSTDLSPEVLVSRQASNYPRFMSVTRLQALQDNQALAAAQRTQIVQAIWGRFSLLALNVLALVMALPFFLQPQPGSLLMQTLKSTGLVATVWGGGLMMLTVPSSLFSPVVAAWLPVIICLPLAAILLQFVRT